MRLIHKKEIVLGEKVYQGIRGFPRSPSSNIAGIVFYPFTVSHFFYHFQIIAGTLFQALGFQQFTLALKKFKLLLQFIFYVSSYRHHVLPGGDEMGSRKYHDMSASSINFPGQGVKFNNPVYFIPKKVNANSFFPGRCRENLYYISPYPEMTSTESIIIALVMGFNQTAQQFFPTHLHSRTQRYGQFVVIIRSTQTIYTGYTGYNNDIAPFQERCGSRMAQLINFIINGGILFDISVSLRYISLRLVIIIIAYKILHCIFREELFEFRVELPGQSFIRRHNQSGALLLFDNFSHGKGFTGTSYSQQGLFPVTLI